MTDAPSLEKRNLYLEGFELGELAMRKAAKWYRQHTDHVERLIASTEDGQSMYAPAGIDLIKPSLWRAPHWRWFFDSKR